MSVQNSATTKMIQNVIDGTTPPLRANTASYADGATKATQDGNGDNIANTYAKKSISAGGFAGGANANVYSDGSGGAIGYSAVCEAGGFAGGANARAMDGAAVGNGASAGNGFAGGRNAIVNADGPSTVQLGEGTNTSDNTLQFRSYQVVDANGNIPAERLKSALLDLIFPVGSIYMNYNSSSSPANTLGGSWTRIYNQFLIGAGDDYTIGSTGGEVSHLLTVNEMPSHSHNIVNSKNSKTGSAYMPIQVSSSAWGLVSQNSTGWIAQDTGYIAETGNNVPHNNMPPYRAVWMWRRTA